MTDVERLTIEATVGRSYVPEMREIVRVSTSYWHDKHGIYSRKNIRRLERKCIGPDLLPQDASMIGADFVFRRILNIRECDDGIYQVVTCNEWKDWETGLVEEYDYILVKL
jgi:hypothetical protein